MKRETTVLWKAVAAFVLLVNSADSAEPAQDKGTRRPNLIFILADDME